MPTITHLTPAHMTMIKSGLLKLQGHFDNQVQGAIRDLLGCPWSEDVNSVTGEYKTIQNVGGSKSPN